MSMLTMSRLRDYLILVHGLIGMNTGLKFEKRFMFFVFNICVHFVREGVIIVCVMILFKRGLLVMLTKEANVFFLIAIWVTQSEETDFNALFSTCYLLLKAIRLDSKSIPFLIDEMGFVAIPRSSRGKVLFENTCSRSQIVFGCDLSLSL